MALPRPILPSPGRPGGDRPSPAFTPPPKRQQTAVACENCRRRKVKCDGNRPSCVNCSRKNLICEYAADAGVGRAGRSVARQEALERDNADLQNRLNQFQEFWALARSLPDDEARSILTRFRQSSDDNPAGLMETLRTAEAFTQLQNAASTPMSQIDREALVTNSLQIEALPWTAVAGDGIVSELIGLFFTWEGVLECPVIDKDGFLDSLRSKARDAPFCSPLLVNSMCALGCFLSKRIRDFDDGSQGVLARRFVDAAEQAYNQDNTPSFKTAIALWILYLYGVAIGQDKRCAKYRYMACSMIKTLNLERKYNASQSRRGSSTIAGAEEHRSRILSRGIWGMFCAETIASLAYEQPSLISPPNIPPWDPVDILRLQSDLSLSVNEIMHYSHRKIAGIGESEDVGWRLQQYSVINKSMERQLPGLPQDDGTSVGFRYLAALHHLVCLVLWRPLLSCAHVSTIADLGSPQKLVIDHCQSAISEMQQAGPYESESSPVWSVLPPARCAFILASQLGKLNDVRVPDLLTRACAMLRRQSSRWPLATYWLQALYSFIETTGTTALVPTEAGEYLSNLDQLGVSSDGEVPIGFVIPMQDELVELGSDSDSVDVAIARLVEKFNSTSLSRP